MGSKAAKVVNVKEDRRARAVKAEQDMVSAAIRRCKLMTEQNHIAIFQMRLENADNEQKEFFQIKRSRILAAMRAEEKIRESSAIEEDRSEFGC